MKNKIYLPFTVSKCNLLIEQFSFISLELMVYKRMKNKIVNSQSQTPASNFVPAKYLDPIRAVQEDHMVKYDFQPVKSIAVKHSGESVGLYKFSCQIKIGNHSL